MLQSQVRSSLALAPGKRIEVFLAPQRIPCAHRHYHWYLHPRTRAPQTISLVLPRHLVSRGTQARGRYPVGYWMRSPCLPRFLWFLNLGKTLPIPRIYGPQNRNASAWPRPNQPHHAKHHARAQHARTQRDLSTRTQRRPPRPHRSVAPPPTPLAKTTIQTPSGRAWRAPSERCCRRRVWRNRAG